MCGYCALKVSRPSSESFQDFLESFFVIVGNDFRVQLYIYVSVELALGISVRYATHALNVNSQQQRSNATTLENTTW